MSYSEETLDQIFNKGQKIAGKNPDLYRRDPMGNEMYRYSYGKTSAMGWNVDHKHPKAKGGSDSMRNFQPMNSRENSRKGDKYPY